MWLERSICIHLEIFILWFLGIISFAGLKKMCWDPIVCWQFDYFLVYFLSHNLDHSHFETLARVPNHTVLSPTYQLVIPVSLLLSQISFPSLLLAEDITVFFLWEKVHKSIWFKLGAWKNDFLYGFLPFTPLKHMTPLPALNSHVCIFLYLCIIFLASWLFSYANY